MLKTLAKYKFVIVLTGYILQISACKVHREPSCCRHTINIVGLLPLWELIRYGGAVIHIYVWKADANGILGQPNIARDGCVRRASNSNKPISKTTGIWKKAWEPALGNNCWSLAWNNEMIVSVRLEERTATAGNRKPKLPDGQHAWPSQITGHYLC